MAMAICAVRLAMWGAERHRACQNAMWRGDLPHHGDLPYQFAQVTEMWA
jgi:hypothetical protein